MEDDASLEVLVVRALGEIYINDMDKLQQKHEQEQRELREKKSEILQYMCTFTNARDRYIQETMSRRERLVQMRCKHEQEKQQLLEKHQHSNNAKKLAEREMQQLQKEQEA